MTNETKAQKDQSELRFAVLEFVPTAQGEGLEHRIALLAARSFCNEMLGNAVSPDAYNLATLAREIAERFVYAHVPVSRLKIARSLARYLAMSAFLADHLDHEGDGR